MERHAALIRALAMKAKGAKLKSDGAALGDERLKAEGRRWAEAGRAVQAGAKVPRH
ncbi:hypothetical protein [Streptomyces sp. NPDC091416]|uniref:hypothetical protein n=1 Tax=Streptomyces sp. NPDC091416 TaxID=3366003 RepID=UPI0038103AE8